MLKTIKSIYQDGRILLDNEAMIPDKTVLFISFNDNSDNDFFLKASESSLDVIWNNDEDNVYELLLKA